jgi:hypothetical protein
MGSLSSLWVFVQDVMVYLIVIWCMVWMVKRFVGLDVFSRLLHGVSRFLLSRERLTWAYKMRRFALYLERFGLCICFITQLFGCAQQTRPKHTWYTFPEDAAFLQEPARPYDVMGTVRAKVNFKSFDEINDEKVLCKNYYNQAVNDLVRMAKEKGAEAVIQVRSVVFLGNGIQEAYVSPECADDGSEGQILTQGVAVKWK